jgi:hypothetical protein
LISVTGNLIAFSNPLSSINFSKLETVGSTMDLVDDVTLTSALFPSLKSVGLIATGVTYYAAYSCPNLTTLLHPALEQVDSDLVIFDCLLLLTVEFPKLVSANITFSTLAVTNIFLPLWGSALAVNSDLRIFSCDSLVSFNFPSLIATQTNFAITSNASLVSFSVPSLVSLTGGCAVDSNPSLTSIDLSSWVPDDFSTYSFFANALSAATVNHILARCVANPAYANGQITLDGGTNSAPTGQGIADKATLQGRGVTVVTN